MKYDVFISSKSEDYSLANELYDYLHNEGYSVFVASKELEQIGEAQYRKAIDAALDATKHMIVVASSIDYINSKWVSYEWSIFSNDINSGYKDGNLLTILSPNIQLKDLPAGLRHQQSFSVDSYKPGILGYLKKSKGIANNSTVISNSPSVSNINTYNCSFFKTNLWKQTLGSDEEGIRGLKDSFLRSRDNIKLLLEKQQNDYTGISYDTIEQIDAFWGIVDTLFKQNIPINPVEGYVLGIAFLLSSPLLSFSSVKGKEAVVETLEWKDIVAGYNQSSESMFDEHEGILSALRALHYREIDSILISVIPAIGSHIVQEEPIRKCFSNAIGTLLKYSGCDWDDYSNLKIVPNRYMEICQNMPIDLQKLSAIYRCVNTVNIFYGRIPDYLFGILKNHHIGLHSWCHDDFKYQLIEDMEDSNLLSLVSNYPFNKSNFQKWNVLHEVVEIIDNDIKATNAILKQKGIDLPYLGLAGAQSIKKLNEILPTEGWEPCNIGVHVGDLKYLIEKLGGTQLYGMDDCLSVIIREMVQNGRDAIKSREKMEQWFNNGAIYIRLSQVNGSYQLEIADNGIGMSKSCIQNHLLCFGESYWSSTLSLRENPGLKASGFSSIGHFGIGFYSLFMLAKYVKVVTRRYTDRVNNYLSVEFLDGLTLMPIISQDNTLSSNMSTIVSFSFDSINVSSEDVIFGGLRYNYSRNKQEIPLEKKICYLVAGLDVDVFYSEGEGEYRLIHQNVNNNHFDTTSWVKNLLKEGTASQDLHIKLERIVNAKGQLRALLTAPQEKLHEGLSVIPTIRGLGSCSITYTRLEYSSLIGFIDFKSGGASRNSFIIDSELNELLTEWLSLHYHSNYQRLLDNFRLSKRYIEAFGGLSIDINKIVSDNEQKLSFFLRDNKINPFNTTTLALIHKRLFVGLLDEYGNYVFGIFKTYNADEIRRAVDNLGLDFLRPHLSNVKEELDDDNSFLNIFNHERSVLEKEISIDKESLLNSIDELPKDADGIIKRYALMLLLHPFREGNERALSFWVDYMFTEIGEKSIEWETLSNEDYEMLVSYSINDYNALKKMILDRQIIS